jgi:hypothetical protein
MGSAVIVLKDTEYDGEDTINISVEFDPEVNVADGDATAAQIIALRMLDAVATPDDMVEPQ